MLLALLACWAPKLHPVETESFEDVELSRRLRDDGTRYTLELDTAPGPSLEVRRRALCVETEETTFDRTRVVTRAYSEEDARTLRSLWIYGGLAGASAVVMTPALLLFDEEDRGSMALYPVGAAGIGIWFLGEALILERRQGEEREHLGELLVEAEPEERNCGSEPVVGGAVLAGGVELGELDDQGSMPVQLESWDSRRLLALAEAERLEVDGHFLRVWDTGLPDRAAAICEQRSEPFEQAARNKHEAAMKRWYRSSLRCMDGTISPTCRCGGSHTGCCSSHGGVSGCARPRPAMGSVPACGVD